MRFAEVHGCPVPARRKFDDLVRRVAERAPARLNSCYRGSDRHALPILRRHGKSTQRELWLRWIRREPGANPANPPGRSTHELRSDGVAYAGPPGRPLRHWQVGMDWTNAPAVVREFNRNGFSAAITYPSNPLESHHVNLRRHPRLRRIRRYIFRVLRRGMRGPRVRYLGWRLRYVDPVRYDCPKSDHFGEKLETAVRRFQRDHDQKVDGVYGFQTDHALDVAFRRARRRAKEEEAKP